MPTVTIVLPAHNEIKNLKKAVKETSDFLTRRGEDFEIIIAEDGSTDGTAEMAESIVNTNPRVWCICHCNRLGRGRALTEAFKKSSGSILVYMDVDLSTDIRFLEPLIFAITDGNDVAIGSRAHPKSNVIRSRKRLLISLIYNNFVRLLLGSNISDHQCGFKAFSQKTILKILDNVYAEHWFWDTEILVLALRMGLSVKEVPIVWRESNKTEVVFFKDIINMGFQVLKLWWRLNIARSYRCLPNFSGKQS